MLRLTAIGNIVKDAEVKTVGNAKVISFTVAVNEKWKDRNGEQQSRTHYIDCSRWVSADGSTAVAAYLKKGQPIFVEGDPSANAYIGNEGNAVGKLNLKVSELKLIGGTTNRTEGDAAPPRPTTAPNTVAAPPTVNAVLEPDDDLPF